MLTILFKDSYTFGLYTLEFFAFVYLGFVYLPFVYLRVVYPLELSVTPLATLSISPNSLCHCAFTHSRSTSHALSSQAQACCLSCHYPPRGSTHSCYSLILCVVPSRAISPLLSHVHSFCDHPHVRCVYVGVIVFFIKEVDPWPAYPHHSRITFLPFALIAFLNIP